MVVLSLFIKLLSKLGIRTKMIGNWNINYDKNPQLENSMNWLQNDGSLFYEGLEFIRVLEWILYCIVYSVYWIVYTV